jgi:hypothetical protein
MRLLNGKTGDGRRDRLVIGESLSREVFDRGVQDVAGAFDCRVFELAQFCDSPKRGRRKPCGGRVLGRRPERGEVCADSGQRIRVKYAEVRGESQKSEPTVSVVEGIAKSTCRSHWTSIRNSWLTPIDTRPDFRRVHQMRMSRRGQSSGRRKPVVDQAAPARDPSRGAFHMGPGAKLPKAGFEAGAILMPFGGFSRVAPQTD